MAERFAVIPNRVLILKQQPRLVCHIKPTLRHRTNAEAKRVPMHAPGNINKKLVHPCFVPRQLSGVGISKKTVQGNASAAPINWFAVQDSSYAVKVQLPHSKASRGTIAAA